MGALATRVGALLAYPLVDLGRTRVTLWGLLTLVALVGLVLAAEGRVRHHVAARALRRTRMDTALQYAIGRMRTRLRRGDEWREVWQLGETRANRSGIAVHWRHT